ncbi:MAG TPA: glycosyltransferase [Verrucomicrobiae bacterium]|nr:glycosyltransferase [Verrucomicrobiae bacterium]
MNATVYNPGTEISSVDPDRGKTKSGRQTSLAGLRICHVSPQQGRRDPRAYTRQSLPLMAGGVQSTIIGTYDASTGNDEVNVISLPETKSRFWRILTASRAIWTAARQKADIYHIHSPENILAALILHLVFRRRVVYDSREDFPSMMLTKEYIPPRLRATARSLTLAAERLAAWCLDGFVTADPGTLRHYARAGKSRKLVFYNFPNLHFFPESDKSRVKKFDLVYRGGLSERAGTLVLFRAIARLKELGTRASLLVFGYTDNDRTAATIRGVVSDLGIEDLVTLGGVIPHSQMAGTLSLARIAVCPLLKIPKFMNNIPVKVFESWACGLPVVASDLPPIRPFFPRNQRHLLTKPGDSEELALVIQHLLARPNRISEYGREAKKLVHDRLNSSMEIHKLLRFYADIMQMKMNGAHSAI